MLETGAPETMNTLRDLLAGWREAGSAGTEDVLGAALPLIEQVASLHEVGLIAPLNGVDALRVSKGHLWFPNSLASEPHIDEAALRVKAGEKDPRQAYYPGYVAWEQLAGHHDQLSDIFVLGLILGGLALRRDLASAQDLQIFVRSRSELMRHNPRLHPVLSRIVEKMTELDRRKRPQDLRQIAKALAHYREQEIAAGDTEEEPLDLSDRGKVRGRLHERLRDRLFEISRRNRLIYFRETGATVNLTVASTPNVIDAKTIKPQQLFYPNERIDLKRPIDLNAWLQFQDYGFLAASLDRIRLDAMHDAREYGFSQLRLVAAFLRWTNLKEAPEERIVSPLILAPATLIRRKGVKDSFRLDVRPAEAEINPALRYHLRKLYDIRLPDTIDASDMGAIRALHADLAQQLEQSAKGVELTLIETPRVAQVQRKARRKLDDFKRRTARVGVKDYGGIAYSYTRPNYDPLGVQIFERDIRVSRAPSREEVDAKPRLDPVAAETGEAGAAQALNGEAKELSPLVHAVESVSRAGSHDWELDLCAVTLANFNYRKMTLVRDYNDLIGGYAYSHANFDRLFSDEGRPAFEPYAGRDGDYMVLPADPSQAEAVARASGGESYVIQGPPGTGKSQTITNLIADYVARGKGVLFVCEKRAALDVVFHRLKQTGLGDVSTLIHDSQGDKKAFIEELKAIYEAWTSKKPREDIAKRRQTLAGEIASRLADLERFSAAMTAPVEPGGPSLRDLIEERLKLNGDAAAAPEAVTAALPGWQAFQAAKPVARMLRDALIASGYDGVLARAPVRLLRGDLARAEDAVERVERALPRVKTALASVAATAADMRGFLGAGALTWEEMLQLGALCRVIEPIAETGQLAILDAADPSAEGLVMALQKLSKLEAAAAASVEGSGWPQDIDVPNLPVLIAAAQKQEGKLLAFLSGDWRRASRVVRENYTGKAPGVAMALLRLAEIQRTAASRDLARAAMEKDCGFKVTPEIHAALERVWTAGSELTNVERDAIRICLVDPGAAGMMVQLAHQSAGLRRVEGELGVLFSGHGRLTHEAIAASVKELESNTAQIAEVGSLLNELDKTDVKISQTLRVLDLPLEQIEVAVLDSAIGSVFKRNRTLDRFDSAKLEEIVADLQKRHGELRRVNSQFAVNASHQGFHADVTRSNEPTVGLRREEVNWRHDFRRGRKTLENEFQKSRAYKSIRELFAGEAGRALRRLKPVWLMSPLSVADILPLEEGLFDVVIFDEASQIPLEDAIPTLYRSKQMIVVGDEMQLPPSQFFASSNGDEEEGGGQELFVYDLNADSFLNRAAAALPHVLLAWHYRSQHEALIQFCNKAFYKGELQTIPSVAELPKREPILVRAADDAKTFASLALQQPLSFHRMAHSPYDSQRNPGEAAYIAHLVREILTAQKGLSIGVVAFSQAQQAAIESALNALAATDRDLRSLLDLEEEREEDGQFVGLFIKNLENVQGDERDVIILSVCYGPGAGGRMLMNFGPVNQNGGEKRLNVIFSRAKRHMMVVSSIEGAQITNTYNMGANALRKYLSYAQAASVGDAGAMAAALTEYSGAGASEADGDGQHVADQIAQELTARGFLAVRNYGQSALKCHVAVKRAGQGAAGDFRLAIQVDDRAHYGDADLSTRYVVRPGVLSAFGWEVMTVLAKDWRAGRAKVMQRIVRRLR